MEKEKKKIGELPINEMKKEVDDFINEVRENEPVLTNSFESIEAPEYSEATIDEEKKVLSYRRKDGVKVEKVGIDTPRINLSKDGLEKLYKDLGIEESTTNYKSLYLPKYGLANIFSETFYLTSNPGYYDKNGIVLIQDFEDTDANAWSRVTLSYFYVKSSLIDNGDGTYSKYNDGVEGHDIKLDFYAAENVKNVNGTYYVKSTLDDQGQPTADSIAVTQIIDAVPYKAWPVDKKTKHNCVIVIDFGNFFSGTFYAQVSYQGSSTLGYRKRNFRFKFFKDSTYDKKKNIKIGELLYQSSFNLKSNWKDQTRIKECGLYRLAVNIWNSRDVNYRYPWTNKNTIYSGATGIIKGFPIRLNINGDFFGIEIFGLKKDGDNYMLKNDSDGIFVCYDGYYDWPNANAGLCADELNDDMSQETADALNVFFAFVNDRLYKGTDDNYYLNTQLTEVDGTMYVTSTLEDGQVVPTSISAELTPFDRDNAPEHMSIIDWIDYFLFYQVFYLIDNTLRNMVIHSREDKKVMYPYLYDLDDALIHLSEVGGTGAGDVLEYTYGGAYHDLAFWFKFVDLYWNEIVNRYCELRNTVFSYNYIEELYKNIHEGVPQEDYALESSKWGNSDDAYLTTILGQIKNRLNWLDTSYFKIN